MIFESSTFQKIQAQQASYLFPSKPTVWLVQTMETTPGYHVQREAAGEPLSCGQ